jgi:hypothetical protein
MVEGNSSADAPDQAHSVPVGNGFAEGGSEKPGGWDEPAACVADSWVRSMRAPPAPRLAVRPDRGRSYVRAHGDVDRVVVGIEADTPSY